MFHDAFVVLALSFVSGSCPMDILRAFRCEAVDLNGQF